MKTRSKLSILAFFSCCALTSMGFANWVISQEGPVTDSTTGGISADSVILSNDYISFKEAKPLRVNKGGFTSGDTTSLTGSFTATFEINLANYSSIFTDGATTEIVLKFAETPANNVFAASDTVAKISVSYEDSSSLIDTAESARSNGTYVTTIDMKSSQTTEGTATFTLTYTFSFTNKDNYQTYIYSVFYPNGVDESKTTSTVQFAFDITIKD